MIRRYAPVLFANLCNLQQATDALSNAIALAIKSCLIVAQSLYAGEQPVACPLPSTLTSVDVSPFVCGQYFPHFQLKRGVPYSDALSIEEKGTCRKYAYNTRLHTHGVLVFMCALCKGVLGFSLMDAAEGPRQVFEILVTRWAKPPRVVFYDNACKLATYCFARDPMHFRETTFLVDHLHFKGHVRCSPTFDPTRFESLVGHLNTQIVEQLWS